MAAKNKQTKEQARRKKVLQAAFEGVKKARIPVDKMIPRLKAGEFAVEAASWLGPGGPAAKGVMKVGKAAVRTLMEKAAARASKVKVTPGSKLAKRTADAKIKEIKNQAAKRRGVLVEKTTVKGGKATTPKLPKGAGGSKPRRSLPRSPNKPAGDAGKRVAKREKYYKEREALKKAAEKAKKKEKFLKGSGAPKTSAKAKSKKGK